MNDEHAPDCPQEHPCPKGHCTGNPECPNSLVTKERYPKLFEVFEKWKAKNG